MRRSIRAIAVLAASAAVSIAAPALAKAPDCSTANTEHCVPIYACVEPGASFFRGRATGEFEGEIIAETTSGVRCTGFWQRLETGAGKVYGDCRDGRSFFLDFSFLHRDSGTTVGQGATSKGETVYGWSGVNVGSFLTDANGQPLSRLRCGDRLYPIN